MSADNIQKSVTICLNTDSACSDQNINIVWLSTPGLLTKCLQDNCITLVPDPGNPEQKCLEGFIYCENEKATCEDKGIVYRPKYFKKCFCVLDSDCGTCGECNDQGLCDDTCTAEELAQGKVCTSDGCGCPPNKPYFDLKTNKCAECISGQVNPDDPCVVCKDGVWEMKDCGDGNTCDGGDCVEDCSKNTDGRTRYNPVTKTCDCEYGFHYDYTIKKCVKDPKSCGPGEEYNPITDNCDPIDCGDPFLIYSVELDDCIPKPCDGDCEDGTGCSNPNCGCSQTTKKCVDCDENPTALGCGPSAGCDGSCGGGVGSCGPGCGCVSGECIDCGNLTPEVQATTPGCENYNPDNPTNPNPDNPNTPVCNDELSLTTVDCGLEGKLLLETACQCEAIGTGLAVTSLSHSGTEGKESYVANFQGEVREEFSNNIDTYKSIPFFSNAIINNSLPIVGSITIKITPTYKNLDTNTYFQEVSIDYNKFIDETTGITETKALFVGISLGASDWTYVNGTTERTGKEFVGYTVQMTVNKLTFHSNCEYNASVVYNNLDLESIDNITTITYLGINKMTTNSSKNPLFTWSKNGAVIRSFYAESDGGNSYIDTLYGPQMFVDDADRGKQELTSPEGELIPMNDYQLEVGCGCDEIRNKEDLVICDIEFAQDTNYTVDSNPNSDPQICNNRLNLTNDFALCPLNRDLSFYGYSPTEVAAYQTKYILKVNGTKVATFVDKNGSGLYVEGTNTPYSGYTTSLDEEITSVSFEMNHGAGCKVTNSVINDNGDPNISITCAEDGTADILITKSGSTATSVNFLNEDYGIPNNGLSLAGLTMAAAYTFVVTFENNCVKTYEIEPDCCKQDDLVVGIVNIANSNLININLNTVFNYQLDSIKINNSEKVNLFTELVVGSDYSYSLLNYSFGASTSLTFTGRTVDGCEYTKVITLADLGVEVTMVLDNSEICVGTGTSLRVTSNQPNVAFTISTPDGDINGTTDPSGNYVLSNVSVAGEYEMTVFNSMVVSITDTLVLITSPSVTGFASESGSEQCAGTSFEITVTGTQGGIVTLNITETTYGGTVVQDEIIVDLGTGTATANINLPNAGTFFISDTGIALSGGCSGAASGNFYEVHVADVPTIVSIVNGCDAPLLDNSDMTFTVTATNATTVYVVIDGVETDMGAPTVDVYELTIAGPVTYPPLGVATIKAVNSNCITEENFTMEDCGCTERNLYIGVQGETVVDNELTIDFNEVITFTSALDTGTVDTYQWYNNAILIGGATSATYVFTGLTGGVTEDIHLSVVDVDGCIYDSTPISINVNADCPTVTAVELAIDICGSNGFDITDYDAGHTYKYLYCVRDTLGNDVPLSGTFYADYVDPGAPIVDFNDPAYFTQMSAASSRLILKIKVDNEPSCITEFILGYTRSYICTIETTSISVFWGDGGLNLTPDCGLGGGAYSTVLEPLITMNLACDYLLVGGTDYKFEISFNGVSQFFQAAATTCSEIQMTPTYYIEAPGVLIGANDIIVVLHDSGGASITLPTETYTVLPCP